MNKNTDENMRAFVKLLVVTVGACAFGAWVDSGAAGIAFWVMAWCVVKGK